MCDPLSSPSLLTGDEPVNLPDLLRRRRAVDAANAQVSRAEAIREFRIVPRSFSEAREELTASLKVRRATVLANYADIVDEIYSRAMPSVG